MAPLNGFQITLFRMEMKFNILLAVFSIGGYLESVERADDGEHDGGHVVEAPPILAVRPNEEDEDADAKKETLGDARKRRGSTASS